jgi:hypothetical protein
MGIRGLTTLLLMAAVSAQGGTDVVRHITPASEEDRRNRYSLAVLELALEKSRPEYGPYQLKPVEEELSQGRAVALLARGRTLDVVWTMTSPKREERLQPVRVPLLKGLMGLRLLIIRAHDQPWFSHIKSPDQLRRLRAGQGSDWPDTRILRANDLPITTASSYQGMFRMLAEGRFDYLPRAINEPWEEVEAFEKLDLAVEEELALYYPTASYFFVAPEDDSLARRLRTGLNKALADGSFDKLFHNHPVNRRAFDRADLLDRRVLRLDNPFLPEATPLEDQRLWWFPSRLDQAENAEARQP